MRHEQFTPQRSFALAQHLAEALQRQPFLFRQRTMRRGRAWSTAGTRPPAPGESPSRTASTTSSSSRAWVEALGGLRGGQRVRSCAAAGVPQPARLQTTTMNDACRITRPGSSARSAGPRMPPSRNHASAPSRLVEPQPGGES